MEKSSLSRKSSSAAGGSKEEQVWRLFASYAIISSNNDIASIREAQFQKMCQDCDLMTTKGKKDGKLTSNQINMLCITIRKENATIKLSNKLTYPVFLQILWKIATLVRNLFIKNCLQNEKCKNGYVDVY